MCQKMSTIVNVSADNLSTYLQQVKSFPVLSAEDEYNISKKYVQTRDEDLSCILINSHLRLVVKLVSKYKGYGLPVSEMIAEGNIGLVYALSKFNPDKGFRFSTYALWWIKAYVQKYILNSWSLVKIGTTASQKKLFFNLNKAKKKFNLIDDKYMSNEIILDIANSLAVSSKDVVDMNMRLRSHDDSLNMPLDKDGDSRSEFLDFIVDNKPNQEDRYCACEIMKQRREDLHKALKILNNREKDIIAKRRLSEKVVTLDELSKVHNISKERVRQIEFNSLKKIGKAMGVHKNT